MNRILVVDDEQKTLRAINRIFLDEKDIELEFADNGPLALEKIKSFQPDAVLLDILMPEMDGEELAKKILESPEIIAQYKLTQIIKLREISSGFIKNEAGKFIDFDKYDTATPIFETPYLSMEKLMEIRYKAHQKFYLRPTHIIRMFGKGRIYGVSALKTSLAYLLRALHIRFS